MIFFAGVEAFVDVSSWVIFSNGRFLKVIHCSIKSRSARSFCASALSRRAEAEYRTKNLIYARIKIDSFFRMLRCLNILPAEISVGSLPMHKDERC